MSDLLQPEQFKRRNFKVSDSPSGYPAHVADVPTDFLVRHADPSRITDPHSLRHVEEIADSMRERGYNPRAHNGFDHWGTQHYSNAAQPIHMTLQPDGGVDVFNGNHRSFAAHRAGLPTVPVLITDFRSHVPGKTPR